MESYFFGDRSTGGGTFRISKTLQNPCDAMAFCWEWTAAKSSIFGIWNLVSAVCGHLETGLGICVGSADLPDRVGHQKNHGNKDDLP